MRVALAQVNSVVGDFPGNTRKIKAFIRRAQKGGADIVVFPEMAICGYPPEDLLHKNHFIDDNLKALASIEKIAQGISAIVGCVHRDKNRKIYNAAAMISEGKIRSVYHKHILPNYGVFDEKRYFSEGKDYDLCSLKGVPLGMTVCEDIWHDKGIHARQAKAGAKVLFNISCSPYNIGKLSQREKMIVARAVSTKAYVCYVNMVGGQDELVFDGGSFFVDPKGNILRYAAQFEEDLIFEDIDIPSGQGKKKNFVILKGSPTQAKDLSQRPRRRYSRLERIYQALTLGTRDYVQKNGFKKVVIGLSGGIDSALVAAIAVKALGRDNVIGVTMPSQYSSKGTRSDAQTLAKNLGIALSEIPIKEIFKSYEKALAPAFSGQDYDVTEENIQARIRGNLLMALSNKFGWLVLTTGNKSEVAVGYCTLYGDMSGGFAVIKDVAKTTVYALCRLINEAEGDLIPQSILDRAPTAELRENQKDQDSLPPYDVLDRLLEKYIEQHESFASLTQGHKKELIRQVVNLVDKSEYKRRQSPPGVKITPRAFGRDWRLPITNRYKEFGSSLFLVGK